MKNSRLIGACCAITLFALANTAQGVVITAPPGLNTGDPYRLAFVTSTARDGLSTDIAVYNTFVTDVANTIPELVALGTTWTAIASTATVDARNNTGTNPADAGVPIYILNGTLLATDNADLWDGTIVTPLNVTENGDEINWTAWTGTGRDGTADYFALGHLRGPVLGITTATDIQWIAGAWPFPIFPATFTNAWTSPVYAMSDVLVSAVPLPQAMWLFGSGVIGLVGVARRKKA